MPLIVDAYNVLHCTHVLPEALAEVSTAGLCDLIARSGLFAPPIQVVCDGAPKPDERSATIPDPVQLLHAGPGRDADSLIEDLITACQHPRHLVVVSNDRRIQAAARRRKAQAMASEVFLRRLAAGLNPRSQDSPDTKPGEMGSTEQWMRIFGFDAPRPASQAETQAPAESDTRHWMRKFGFDPDPEPDSTDDIPGKKD